MTYINKHRYTKTIRKHIVYFTSLETFRLIHTFHLVIEKKYNCFTILSLNFRKAFLSTYIPLLLYRLITFSGTRFSDLTINHFVSSDTILNLKMYFSFFLIYFKLYCFSQFFSFIYQYYNNFNINAF